MVIESPVWRLTKDSREEAKQVTSVYQRTRAASCRIPASRTRGQRQCDSYCDGSRMLSSTSRVIASMSFV
ncbi:hypothetical protein PC116_g10335 [Phytophthora cactorum]|nr:hypothetical protein PC111_g19433 [Phytophthora cactorum]KAG2817557.1 hypothetical protein PC112_g13002 [Phytophthora cactorum]KAG3007579.1 hypothetical protein PC119_g14519 [Phytophthora cactorum]KAG3057313.1 hypothetical protein PC121_g14903 [Phytophthora cactorum]KAG4241734.1 hypothetical protein PC116_g10335 [Phytophthora cactorum]